MLRILLVEDNDMNRDMLSRRLVRNGYEVLSRWMGNRVSIWRCRNTRISF